MKLVIGVVLLPELQIVNPGVKNVSSNDTNVFLIRPHTVGRVFFTLDAIPGNVIHQLVYDWLSDGGGTMADTAGVETAA